MSTVSDVRQRLADEDVEYQRLSRKHQEYDARLHDLQSRRYLTEGEKLEEVKLKKLKLAIKDHMEAMVRRESL